MFVKRNTNRNIRARSAGKPLIWVYNIVRSDQYILLIKTNESFSNFVTIYWFQS